MNTGLLRYWRKKHTPLCLCVEIKFLTTLRTFVVVFDDVFRQYKNNQFKMIYIPSRVFFPLSNDIKMKIVDQWVAEILVKGPPPQSEYRNQECLTTLQTFVVVFEAVFLQNKKNIKPK